jgi:hypothetical protein
VLEDFKRALARVQSDFDFFVDCQARPAAALAGYDLTGEERLALTDAEKLADVLTKGMNKLIITFSGRHDWINRTREPTQMAGEIADVDRQAKLIGAARAVKRARTDEARMQASVTMMELME